MSSTFGSIELGKRSLMAHMQQISTAGHNISNADTEGYSRQRVQVKATDPLYRPTARTGNFNRKRQSSPR